VIKTSSAHAISTILAFSAKLELAGIQVAGQFGGDFLPPNLKMFGGKQILKNSGGYKNEKNLFAPEFC
jgi:hypothetical protein